MGQDITKDFGKSSNENIKILKIPSKWMKPTKIKDLHQKGLYAVLSKPGGLYPIKMAKKLKKKCKKNKI